MDQGFAIICPLAQRSRLESSSCPSARAFAPRFLQTPLRSDAFALRYDFTSIRLSKGLSPSSCRTCSAHKKGQAIKPAPQITRFYRGLKEEAHTEPNLA